MKPKKQSKFTLDKFEVAKFKNLKSIVGGLGNENGGNEPKTTTDSVIQGNGGPILH